MLGKQIILTFLSLFTLVTTDQCDLKSGNYKLLKFSDGKLFFFQDKHYYLVERGKKLTEADYGDLTDIYPNTNTPIDECFIQNGNVFYIRGDESTVYVDNEPQTISWSKLKPYVAHVEIYINGENSGFFAPPKSNPYSSGYSQSVSGSTAIISYGGGGISLISTPRYRRIAYSGWSVPPHFNAYFVENENTVYFFDGSEYTVVTRNSNRKLLWKNATTFFNC